MTTVANISLWIYVDVDDLVIICIPGMQKKAYIIKTKKLRDTVVTRLGFSASDPDLNSAQDNWVTNNIQWWVFL